MSRIFYGALFVTLSVASAWPLLRAEHPPLQDLPQHLAAIHVLKTYPAQGLGEMFEIDLGRTQYISYYGAAWLLSYPLGVALGNKLLLICAIVALPWSLSSLLKALERDRRLALFAFPLVYNAHLVLGFFNFIAALPLMFWGLTCALKLRARPTLQNELALAACMTLCFYTHVVPFGFLALGTFAVLLGSGVGASLKRMRVFAPSALALGLWLARSPAGQATLEATTLAQQSGAILAKPAPVFASPIHALRDAPMWLTDVLHSERDEILLIAWFVLMVSALSVAPMSRLALVNQQETASARAFGVRLALLCPLALIAYFVTPLSYDWIWPISARFPLIAALFAILLLPKLRGAYGLVLLACVSLVSLTTFRGVDQAFTAFEREEVGDIDAAIASIPEGQRVAGLIFDKGSRHVKFTPFIHYVALYQAQKGGAVMFTFADFPQSPFHFREHGRPPRVPPRWEWTPERVDPGRDLAAYQYVLVRGGPGRIGSDTTHYEPVFSGERWRVYRRI
jgi:hypothetical protein